MRFKRLIAGFLTTSTLAVGGTVAVDAQINPYENKETHYELAIVSDIPQGERVEIAKDRAAMTLKGWNDEYAITITPQIPTTSFGAIDKPFTVPADRKLLSKKMEYRTGDVTAFIEPKEGTENEFDIDFTLHSKPDTNVFEYKIEGAEEFDFFYQPELTPEEIARGDTRPQNVVGSYAVYHKTKANHRVGSTNYATGKAFHIYRPKAIDANGEERWAELAFADGVLTVTLDDQWLSDAVYPIVVDPTFGITTIGSTSALGGTENAVRPERVTTTEAGDVTMVSAYMTVTTAAKNSKTAFYEFVSTSDAGSLLAESTQRSNGTSAGQWYNYTMSYTVTGGTDYYLGAYTASGSGVASMFYDTGGETHVYLFSGTYPTFPNPATSESTETFIFSIYATYTASGGTTPGEEYMMIFSKLFP